MTRHRGSRRQTRKRRRSGARGPTSTGIAPTQASSATEADAAGETRGRPYSRSEEKNAAVRASLEPLREGERPWPVTVGAVVAFLLAAANLAFYFAGVEIDGERPSPLSLAFPVLLLVAAWGMWRARYWAVLGMQAVLALILIGFSISLMLFAASGDVLRAAISLTVIGAAGVLFWFMVKAMARIQMPERR